MLIWFIAYPFVGISRDITCMIKAYKTYISAVEQNNMHAITKYRQDPYTLNLVVTKEGINEIIPSREKSVGD